MRQNRFIADNDFPWVEVRLTEESSESYKPHSHSELSVGAITMGTVFTTVQGREYMATAGSLVVVGPAVVRSCNPVGGPRSYVMVHFDIAWWLALQKVLGLGENLLLPESPVLNSSELFESLVTLSTLVDTSCSAWEKTERITAFARHLLHFISQTTQHDAITTSCSIDDMKEILGSSLDEIITLEQVAERVGYSPHYLLRYFKKNAGLTPHEYRLNLRIEKAKALLRKGIPAAMVAAETGFVDQSHFHRTFKHFVAATPRQFQRRGPG